MSSLHPLPDPPRAGRAWWESAATVAVVVAIAALYLWTASSSSTPFGGSGEREDYYNRLSHGFRSGHLYMEVAPVPNSAPDAAGPGLGHLPFLLDASFYHGKYYLYFGPAPVVVAFLPYRLLTGGDLSDNFVAALFAVLGYILSVVLVVAVRRRFFPAVPAWTVPVFALVLGLGNVCPVMLRHPMFYEVAIGSAYCFLMLCCLAVYSGVTTTRPRRAWAWLSAAGLAYGLAVASRADYAFGALALLVPFAWVWRAGAGGRRRGALDLVRAGAVAFGPLLLCAAGLLLYNYERFGNLLEFGVRYQFTYRPVFSPRFAWHNLKLYYLSLPELSWYFPFTLPINEGVRPAGYVGFEHIHGQVASLGLLPALAAGFVLLRRRWRLAMWRPLAALLLFAGIIYLNNLVVLLCLAGRANRYMVDFQPLWLIGGIVGCWLAWEWFAPSSARRRIFASGVLLVVTAIAAQNILSSFQLYELLRWGNPHAYARLAHALNLPSVAAERWLEPRGGAITMDVRFPAGTPGRREPLVITGSAEYNDFLVVQYLEGEQLRLEFHHFGYAGIMSAPITVSRDRVHQLGVDLGSLYPPLEHPYFDRLPLGARRLIKRTVHVTLDGQDILFASHDLNDASPGGVYIGRNPFAPLYTKPAFGGVIRGVRRAGWDAAVAAHEWPEYGAVRLRVRFPAGADPGRQDPVVVTGDSGRADGIFVRYEDASHIRFGCDRLGAGATLSDPVAVDFSVPHDLVVAMGSLYPGADALRQEGLAPFEVNQLKTVARVQLDGHEVFRSSGPFHDAAPKSLDVGGNFSGLSSMTGVFTGDILNVKRDPLPVAHDIAGPGAAGPIRMQVIFPRHRTGHREPLVSTGRTGAGDVLSVEYIDDQRLRFTLDHWGTAATSSAPVVTDYSVEHVLEISLGSLYPSDGLGKLSTLAVGRVAEWRRQVSVLLDGREVLAQPAAFYISTPAEVAIGTNAIGASSCEAGFTGGITGVERPLMAAGQGAAAGASDAVVLEISLPKNRTGVTEPLLVTGRAGAADAVLLTYIDSGHVGFSWDHWGSEASASASIPVDYNILHRVEVSLGSLSRDTDDKLSRTGGSAVAASATRHLLVRLDDRVVFEADGDFYPAVAGDPRLGENTVGLSTAEPAFTGAIEAWHAPAPAGPAKPR